MNSGILSDLCGSVLWNRPIAGVDLLGVWEVVLYSQPMDSPSFVSLRAAHLIRRMTKGSVLSFVLSVLESEQVEFTDSMDGIDSKGWALSL
jgi:hypothetical protein